MNMPDTAGRHPFRQWDGAEDFAMNVIHMLGETNMDVFTKGDWFNQEMAEILGAPAERFTPAKFRHLRDWHLKLANDNLGVWQKKWHAWAARDLGDLADWLERNPPR